MNLKLAIQDIIDGAKNYEFWMTFGMNDVISKYRRSKIGQWWITLSVAVFIVIIGGLYRGIFDVEGGSYAAYLSVGYILWIFISDSISMGCNAIGQAKSFLLQKSWPISAFGYRLVYREVIMNLHHAVIFIPIFLWVKLWPGFGGILLGLLGYFWCVFTAFWVSLFVGIVSLRYRDFPPIVASLMRMAFFATPIIWVKRDLGAFGEIIYTYNPFRYYLDIVRLPLLTGTVNPHEWLVSLALGVATMLLTLITLAATKNKLTYWL